MRASIPSRWMDAILLSLALLTAVVVAVALGGVGRSSPSTGDDDGANGGDAAIATQSEQASATSGPDSRSAGDGADETTSPDTPQERVDAALAGEDGESVNVLVLGDDTSNQRSEWVQRWGIGLAEERPVTVLQWDEGVDVGYADEDVLSESGDGAPLTIWSASRTGTDIATATDRLDGFLRVQPDLVVINLGVNDTADTARDDVDDLAEAIAEQIGDVPLVLVRQSEGGASSEVDEAMTAWAEDEGDVLVWDAREATSARDWADTILGLTTDA